MATQDLDKHPEGEERYFGPLGTIPTLGFAKRRKRPNRSEAWRDTVTQHAPESLLAVRLTLQARISALG